MTALLAEHTLLVLMHPQSNLFAKINLFLVGTPFPRRVQQRLESLTVKTSSVGSILSGDERREGPFETSGCKWWREMTRPEAVSICNLAGEGKGGERRCRI